MHLDVHLLELLVVSFYLHILNSKETGKPTQEIQYALDGRMVCLHITKNLKTSVVGDDAGGVGIQ